MVETGRLVGMFGEVRSVMGSRISAIKGEERAYEIGVSYERREKMNPLVLLRAEVGSARFEIQANPFNISVKL